jgi:hypothetical protein
MRTAGNPAGHINRRACHLHHLSQLCIRGQWNFQRRIQHHSRRHNMRGRREIHHTRATRTPRRRTNLSWCQERRIRRELLRRCHIVVDGMMTSFSINPNPQGRRRRRRRRIQVIIHQSRRRDHPRHRSMNPVCPPDRDSARRRCIRNLVGRMEHKHKHRDRRIRWTTLTLDRRRL